MRYRETFRKLPALLTLLPLFACNANISTDTKPGTDTGAGVTVAAGPVQPTQGVTSSTPSAPPLPATPVAPAAAVVAPAVPAAPLALTVTASATAVTLSWPAVTSATGYRVYRAASAAVPAGAVYANVTANAFTDNHVAASTTYTYLVTSVSAAGESKLAATNTVATATATLSVTLSASAWATTIRAKKAITAHAVMSDGTTQDVSAQALWTSSAPDVARVAVVNGAANIAALRVGSATIVASFQGQTAETAVTVGTAPVLVQWGGWQTSGYGLYSPAGVPTSTLVSDALSVDRRGMLAVPGGFLSVGTDPNLSIPISEFVTNTGATDASHFFLQQGAWEAGPQAIVRASDGRYLVPQGSGSIVIYGASGAYVGAFTTAGLAAFTVVELANKHLIAPSWDGRLVEFAPAGGSYVYVKDFASGFANPFGADYCAAGDSLVFNDYSANKVYSCSSSGSCVVLANHGLPQGRGLRINLNSGDCSFFLNYYDISSSSYKIALFNADGTVANAAWATLAGGINKVFAIDFQIPQDQ